MDLTQLITPFPRVNTAQIQPIVTPASPSGDPPWHHRPYRDNGTWCRYDPWSLAWVCR
jgi:hypothetical protein